jgi:hypothetical protein
LDGNAFSHGFGENKARNRKIENWTEVIEEEIGYDCISMRKQRLHEFLNNASDLKKNVEKS